MISLLLITVLQTSIYQVIDFSGPSVPFRMYTWPSKDYDPFFPNPFSFLSSSPPFLRFDGQVRFVLFIFRVFDTAFAVLAGFPGNVLAHLHIANDRLDRLIVD